jgi:hypothetical protein
MPYTNEENGRLNNFAVEPKVYKAEPPTKKEQRNYLIMGVGATVLVAVIVYIAFAASNMG